MGHPATASLNTARAEHTATLLQNGQVLVVGGWNSSSSSPTATAELYDPVAGTFTYTAGSLSTPVDDQSATLLNDGTVLIAGGDTLVSGAQTSVANAEVYNPTTGTFTATSGNLNAARESHTATLLTNGEVLIAAGSNIQTQLLASAELYNPATKAFTLTSSLEYARSFHTATLLNSGQALIVGGVGSNGQYVGPAELYNPTTATFSVAGNLNIPRGAHSAALLNDATVLIAGGDSEFFEGVPQAEIYQPVGTPTEPPDSLQITPVNANIVVGGTQHFNAIDNFGNPRQDVTWTVSSSSLASVTTDENDAAVLTGLAAGQVTLTATAETTSGQEQVTILTAGAYLPGTVIWSAPPVAGFSPLQLVQAVPTSAGPDLYSTQLSSAGTQSVVQALTADGRQLWQTALPTLNSNSVPDGAGGLIIAEYDTCASGQTNPLTVMDLDPVYGQPVWSLSAAGIQEGNNIVYCYGNGYDAPQIAVRGDGAVVISEPTNNGFPPLSVMNIPPNGAGVSYPIPPSSNTVNGNTIYPQCCMGPPMVNVDGTIYVEYEVRNVVNNVITSDTLYLQQIDLNNNWPSQVLSSTTQNEALLPGPIIPDGQGGVLATWTISPSNPPVPQYPYQAADVVSGVVGTPYNLPFSPTKVAFGQSPTIVLGEGGVAFATNGTDTVNGPVVASFSITSGSVNWSYQASAQATLSIIEATSGNGLVAKTTQSGTDTVLIFNSSGVQSQAMRRAMRSAAKSMAQSQAALSGFSNMDYYSNGWWVGMSAGGPVAVLGTEIQSAMSSYPHLMGNNSKQSAHPPVVSNFETVDPQGPGGWTAAGFQGRYDNTVNAKNISIATLTAPSFNIYGTASGNYGAASESNFIGQIFKPIDAVAFIGHSLQGPSGGAIGICFGQTGNYQGLPLYPCDSTGQGGYYIQSNGAYYQVFAAPPPLATQAKIIFFAACDLDTTMQNFFGFTNSTVGRALLFPQNVTDIDLDMGEYEWEQILANLTSGQNLQSAVANANTATAKITWYQYNPATGGKSQVPAQAWQVIGDSGNGGAGIHF